MSCAERYITTVRFRPHAHCEHIITLIAYLAVDSTCTDKSGRLRACRLRGDTNGVGTKLVNRIDGVPFGQQILKLEWCTFRLVGMAKHTRQHDRKTILESTYELI